jgi:hypothetical protein
VEICTEESYKVVKFIVNVRLMEKRVNSQVGSVYDTQNRRVGSTLNIESTTRPSMPTVDDGAFSAAFMAASDVCRDSGVLEMSAAELFRSDVTASGAAMIGRVLVMEGRQPAKDGISRGTVCRPTNIRLGKLQTHWVRGPSAGDNPVLKWVRA